MGNLLWCLKLINPYVWNSANRKSTDLWSNWLLFALKHMYPVSIAAFPSALSKLDWRIMSNACFCLSMFICQANKGTARQYMLYSLNLSATCFTKTDLASDCYPRFLSYRTGTGNTHSCLEFINPYKWSCSKRQSSGIVKDEIFDFAQSNVPASITVISHLLNTFGWRFSCDRWWLPIFIGKVNTGTTRVSLLFSLQWSTKRLTKLVLSFGRFRCRGVLELYDKVDDYSSFSRMNDAV